ncbi:hypothetical protein GQR58_006841 [Nymphon striatum]|nr:hypothetical protein GQR58_006841 [Nymphon striatum]
MSIAERSIRQKTVSWMVIILLIAGGILSFNGLGRLEDPNFTIKQAMIVTSYPGASATEVEEEITLPLETTLQTFALSGQYMQDQLPAGSNSPIVNTEFGDVFGYFMAITGKDYNYADLKNYVDYLKRELVVVNGVGKVQVGGTRSEELIIEINRSRMTALGLSITSFTRFVTDSESSE